MSSIAQQRLFFALWPDAATRAHLAALSEKLARAAGRRIAAESLHITLVFLGGVTGEVREQLEQMAGTVRNEGFRLRLDHCGFWPRARVVWVGAHEVPLALLCLQARLAEGARRCELSIDMRPYAPHVTLLRDAKHPPLADPATHIEWQVNDFALVESCTRAEGVRYTVLRTWPLAAAGDAAKAD